MLLSKEGQDGRSKRQARELLKDKIAKAPAAGILIIGGDMKTLLGQRRDGFENEMCCFGLGKEMKSVKNH